MGPEAELIAWMRSTWKKRGNHEEESKGALVFGTRRDGAELALCVGKLSDDCHCASTLSPARGNRHISSGSSVYPGSSRKGFAHDLDTGAPYNRVFARCLTDNIQLELPDISLF